MRAVPAGCELDRPPEVLSARPRLRLRRPLRGAALAAILGLAASESLASPPAEVSGEAAEVSGEAAEVGAERGAPVRKRIDLNTATLDELTTLKGIGRRKAEAIIAYRSRQRFTRLTQLLKVKGIGKKTLTRLRPFIAISPPSPTATTASSPSRPPPGATASARTANKAAAAPRSEGGRGQGMVPGCS